MSTRIEYEEDVGIINALNIFGCLLGIVPSSTQRYYRGYILVLLLLLISVTGVTTWGRFRDTYKTLPSYTVIITDMAFNISLLITNIVSILGVSLWHPEDFKSFVNMCLETNNQLFKTQREQMGKRKTFYLKIAISHLFIIFVFGIDCHVWIHETGLKQHRYYFFQYFQQYHSFIMVTLMYKYALLIKIGLQKINELLSVLSGDIGQIGEIRLAIGNPNYQYDFLRYLSCCYKRQLEQINLFNDIFGWQILFFTLSIMTGMLNPLAGSFVYMYMKRKEERFRTDSEINLLAMSLVRSMWQLVLGITLIAFCSNVVAEADRTAKICFKMLLKLPIELQYKQHIILKKELDLLSKIADYLRPSFSAAGFFGVNYSLVLAVFGSVTSYVIVLLQFSK